jgi:hypothetical protein
MRINPSCFYVAAMVAFISLFSSCRKDHTEQYPQFDVITLKNVYGGDTATYNLTIESGHRELPEITIPSKHGSFNAISKESPAGWYVFKYKPEIGFTGGDSVVFESIEPVEKQILYTHLIITVR